MRNVVSIAALMHVIHGGIGALLGRAHRRPVVWSPREARTSAEALFAVYYLGLMGWLNGGMTKAGFERRLRQQIALILGASGQSAAEQALATRKPKREPGRPKAKRQAG